ELLLVLAGQRHEVDVARLRRPRRGDQHHAVAAANDDRATRLVGPLSGLDDDLFAADNDGLTNERHACPLGWSRRRPGFRGLVPLSNLSTAYSAHKIKRGAKRKKRCREARRNDPTSAIPTFDDAK